MIIGQFSAGYLICRHVRMDRQTDGQTDKLVWFGLSTNLRFLQVKVSTFDKTEFLLVTTPPPPVRRHHQITALGRDP